ncbi:MAG TPA: amidohydrolase family protein [Gemmataceae bacterium]|jgi:cytosine/adenosine deaminase-related metal-dependent hydrolase|nr:amidohydrolase family protein [Gemmataceae bacterium]
MTDYVVPMSPADEQPWTLTARWIFPVAGPPLEQGTITIAGERIVGVEARGKSRPDQDLGNAAILPGLVNAHSHLDLTGLRGKAPPGEDFTQWLRAVIGHRRGQSEPQIQADIHAGLRESVHYGTSLLGDISAQGASWPALSEASYRGRAVVFHELLGLTKVRAGQAWAQACRWLQEHPPTDHCRPGLSPHAPYSVRAALCRAVVNHARQTQLPIAVHLAETKAELELLEKRSGPFADFLREVGVWDPEGLVANAGEILELTRDLPQCLIAHGNYLLASAVPRHDVVVYCPRTHAAFAHAPYPLRDYLAAGVRVALGTDSLASNPDLNLLAEARFVRDTFPDLAGDIILRMATLWGAEALGWESETGSLVAGKSADLVVAPLPDDHAAEPFALLWQTPPVVTAVLLRGRWIDLEVPPGKSY